MSVLSVGLAVADHLCEPIARLPIAGELVLTERLGLAVGGCAANVALDLARLDVPVGICARIGRDLLGQFVRETLAAGQVDVTPLVESSTHQTSATLIVNVRGEDRRFIHTLGVNALFNGSEIAEEQLRKSRILYVGGYFAMPQFSPPALRDLFRTAHRLGVQTVLDVVLAGPADHEAALRVILPETDVFLPNTDEAQIMTGLPTALEQARCFQTWGAKTSLVTCGGAGAVLISATESFRVNSFTVPFVDGTGSGDAFDAGVIYGLLQGANWRDCVTYGSALGASCVRQVGATAGVFTRCELDDFLAENTLDFRPLD